MSSLANRVVRRYASYFDVGSIILYGKWKNHRGRIVGFGADKYGNPTVEIEPIPKGRKSNKILGLYRIWRADVKEKALANKVSALRVASRYILSKRNLGKLLNDCLVSLKEGNVEPAIQALDSFWVFLDIKELPAEIGSHLLLNAEWLYALGPRDRKHVSEIVREVKDLRRSLYSYRNQGSIPEKLIKRFEALTSSASWLDSKVHSEEDEFSHGDFTIIPMPGVPRIKLQGCLEALDKASEIIRHKFPKLLYGKVYIAKSVAAGVANYIPEQDTIALSLRAAKTRGDVLSLCHEFGHRYEQKFWKDKDQKNDFWELSNKPIYETVVFDKGTRSKLADEFIETAEAQIKGKKLPTSDLLNQYLKYLIHKNGPKLRDLSQDFLKDPNEANRKPLWIGVALPTEKDVIIQTDKIIRDPIAVTPYGKKNWKENFAEAFAHYMLGMPLPQEVASIMEKLT